MLKLAALSLLLASALAIKCYSGTTKDTDCGSTVTQCSQTIVYLDAKVVSSVKACGCAGAVSGYNEDLKAGSSVNCCSSENCNSKTYTAGDKYSGAASNVASVILMSSAAILAIKLH